VDNQGADMRRKTHTMAKGSYDKIVQAEHLFIGELCVYERCSCCPRFYSLSLLYFCISVFIVVDVVYCPSCSTNILTGLCKSRSL